MTAVQIIKYTKMEREVSSQNISEGGPSFWPGKSPSLMDLHQMQGKYKLLWQKHRNQFLPDILSHSL